MPWPLSQDYNEALQNPQSSFSDPELRQGQVAVNALGIPQPCSGNFADVYAVECAASKTKWAVKCFTREVHGLRERYSEISKYLQQVRLPFSVDFQYLEQGIRISGRWYPILKMHWVEGLTLNAFVRHWLDKPAMLEKLSRVWVRMARRLREADLAHCDLQHGNVLLVPDNEASALAVKLIDYDGMWVPALAKVPSGEIGHPSYQHPQRRRTGVYNAEVDRFPLLAIHVALRALIAGGKQLWERYDTGDNLLFRQTDFEAPTKSSLLAQLLRMNHPEVRDLTIKLVDSARLPLEQTPHLADLVPEEKPSATIVPRSQSSAAPRERNAAAVKTEPNPFQDIKPAGETRGRNGALLPWMTAGGIAACAVVGSVLLWGKHPVGSSKKASETSAFVQAKDESIPHPMEEPSPTPQGTQPPAPVDKGDPPLQNAPESTPSRPTPDKPSLSPKKTITPSPAKSVKPKDPPRPAPNPKSVDGSPKPANGQASETVPALIGGKMPVPDENVLKSTIDEIRDTYKAEYASTDSSKLGVLAEKLLKRGQKSFEPPERRFALLREAGAVAARAGDPLLSVRALDELSKLFAIEALSMKTAIVQETAKNVHTLDTSKSLFELARDLLAMAIRNDDYENAERLVKSEEVAAFKAGIPRSALRDTSGEVQRLKIRYASLKSIHAKLTKEPNDAEANRIVGSFRCFDKGDWENGLPLLVRSDDPKLKMLAEKDLSAPATVDACVELGDGWWQLAKKAASAPKGNLSQRACHWYQRAVAEATEPTRSRIVANIRSYNKSFPALAWGRLDISQATLNVGSLLLSKGDKEIVTRASFAGPIEITALARTEKNNIRLRGGKGSCVIFNWENKPEELRITRPDGNNRPESGSLATAPLNPLRPNTWYLLSWRITEEGMSVSVNGRVIFSENHTNDLTEKHPISVHSVDSVLEVMSFSVHPIRKKSG